MLKLGILSSSSGNTVKPTTIEVDPNRTKLILHRRRERLHDRNITIKSGTDEPDAFRWNRAFISSHTESVLVDVRELPPSAKARLRINVHNFRHCARSPLGGTAVMDVVFLQRVSPRLFSSRMSLTQLL